MMGRIRWVNLGLCALAGGGAGVCIALGFYITAATLAVVAVNCMLAPIFWKRVFWVGYRNGWLTGRQAMLNSMAEATQRHMSMPEWIEAEMERDGFHVVHIDVDE
jgi:hypothetical protein